MEAVEHGKDEGRTGVVVADIPDAPWPFDTVRRVNALGGRESACLTIKGVQYIVPAPVAEAHETMLLALGAIPEFTKYRRDAGYWLDVIDRDVKAAIEKVKP